MYLNLEEKIKKLELENENLRRDVEDLKDEKEVLKDAIDNEANEKYLLKLMVDGSKINENPANLSYDNYFYFTLYFNMLFPQWKEVSRKFIHEKVGECFYSFNVQKLLPNFPSQYSVQSLRNFSFDFFDSLGYESACTNQYYCNNKEWNKCSKELKFNTLSTCQSLSFKRSV